MRHTVAIVAALVLVATLPVGSGGFTAGIVPRPADASVVSDDRANLGYEAACDSGALAVTLTNRFSNTTLEASITVGGTVQASGVTLSAGEETTVEIDDAAAEEPILVRAFTPDGVMFVEIERSVPEDCGSHKAISWVTYCGGAPSSITITPTDGDGPTAVTWNQNESNADAVLYKAGQPIYDTSDDGGIESGEGTLVETSNGGGVSAQPCEIINSTAGTKFEYNETAGTFERE